MITTDYLLTPQRVVLLEAWKTFEQQYGSAESIKKVQDRMPRVVKKRREAAMDSDGMMEEFYDLLFPDDEEGKGKPAFKLLQMAHAWKAAQAQTQASEEEHVS